MSQPSPPPSPDRRRPSRPRLWAFRLLSVMIGCLFAFAILEGFLRWYDPFSLRVQRGRLRLSVNTTIIFDNTRIERVDRRITHSKNSLGFRGPEPPADFDRALTLITVGGSTTECAFVSDGKPWPARLQVRLAKGLTSVWLNNAGMDGHSTHGHLVLMREYVTRLRPDVVIFMMGLNDIGHLGETEFDRGLVDPDAQGGVYRSLVETYAVFSAYDSWRRHRQAEARGLTHRNVAHQDLVLAGQKTFSQSAWQAAKALKQHKAVAERQYRPRVLSLLQLCREHGIQPILVTQTALYGPAIDDVTGANLGTLAVGRSDGATRWKILELYNDVTRSVARQQGIPCVDLAAQMRKSSRYFYDFYHFTNAGADAVAEILHRALMPVLAERFPAHVR